MQNKKMLLKRFKQTKLEKRFAMTQDFKRLTKINSDAKMAEALKKRSTK